VKIESGPKRTNKANSHKSFAENLTADLLKCSNAARRLGYSHRTHLERLEPRPLAETTPASQKCDRPIGIVVTEFFSLLPPSGCLHNVSGF
jgi:hypothetical protein